MQRAQLQHISFLRRTKLYAIIGAALLNIGWLTANPYSWILGLFYLRHASWSVLQAITSLLVLQYYYHSVFWHALLTVYPWSIALLINVLMSALLMSLWHLWYYCAHRALSAPKLKGVILVFVFLVLSEYAWQALSIGLYRTTPMLANPITAAFTSHLQAYAMVSFLMLVSIVVQYPQWLLAMSLLLLIPKKEIEQIPNRLSMITIVPEGQVVDQSKSAIFPEIEQLGESYYSIYRSNFGLNGLVRKRHLVPWIESGYESGGSKRLLCGKSCYLVMICYDALFNDYLEELSEATAIIVVSNLSDFANTPMPYYFEQQLAYIYLSTNSPVQYVDQLKKKSWGYAVR